MAFMPYNDAIHHIQPRTVIELKISVPSICAFWEAGRSSNRAHSHGFLKLKQFTVERVYCLYLPYALCSLFLSSWRRFITVKINPVVSGYFAFPLYKLFLLFLRKRMTGLKFASLNGNALFLFVSFLCSAYWTQEFGLISAAFIFLYMICIYPEPQPNSPCIQHMQIKQATHITLKKKVTKLLN